jgi:opacity protein-like surface antigen
MERMSIFSFRLALALALAALCLGARNANAQAAPVAYWTPGWPLGFGGNLAVDANPNTYGNFPGFDAARGGGFSTTRFNFPNGMFVGSEGGGVGLGINRFSQDAAFGNSLSLRYEGVQFGYNFQSAGNLPVTVYAGFDTLKYRAGPGSPFASFDSTSGTVPGYRAHAGVEFQPASNLTLSLGVGYTQQPGRLDSVINSPALLGAPPFAIGGQR